MQRRTLSTLAVNAVLVAVAVVQLLASLPQADARSARVKPIAAAAKLLREANHQRLRRSDPNCEDYPVNSYVSECGTSCPPEATVTGSVECGPSIFQFFCEETDFSNCLQCAEGTFNDGAGSCPRTSGRARQPPLTLTFNRPSPSEMLSPLPLPLTLYSLSCRHG